MDSLSAGSGLTGAQKDELMDQVKQQIAVANAQELLSVSYCLIIPGFVCINITFWNHFAENDWKVL